MWERALAAERSVRLGRTGHTGRSPGTHTARPTDLAVGLFDEPLVTRCVTGDQGCVGKQWKNLCTHRYTVT
jgi:hypothetical protein